MSMRMTMTEHGPVFHAGAIVPALDEEGHTVIFAMGSLDAQQGVGIHLGDREAVAAVLGLLRRHLDLLTVPDDARELTACPTPRDVFGGRHRP